MSVEARSNNAADPRGRRLESWKEIAAYLGRDVTTARRWEKQGHLPVHRLQHNKLGSVYAYTSELDAWRDNRRFWARLTLQKLTTNRRGIGGHVAGFSWVELFSLGCW